jgi:hypothetical protein
MGLLNDDDGVHTEDPEDEVSPFSLTNDPFNRKDMTSFDKQN